jgi:hypothetical protein
MFGFCVDKALIILPSLHIMEWGFKIRTKHTDAVTNHTLSIEQEQRVRRTQALYV